MFLVFSREYREMKKLMSNLIKKAKESKQIKQECCDGKEVYELDSISIVFVIHNGARLDIKNKSGEHIAVVDCINVADQFCYLLEKMRKIYKEWVKKSKEIAKAEIEQKRKETKKIAEQQRLNVFIKANERLRGL